MEIVRASGDTSFQNISVVVNIVTVSIIARKNRWSARGPLRQSTWIEIAQLIVGDVAAGLELPQCPWGPAVHMAGHFMLF